MSHEVFGASSVVVCRDEAELLSVLKGLEGQLTVSLQIDTADEVMAARLMPALDGTLTL